MLISEAFMLDVDLAYHTVQHMMEHSVVCACCSVTCYRSEQHMPVVRDMHSAPELSAAFMKMRKNYYMIKTIYIMVQISCLNI